jgi:hypothetical protein
MTGMHEHLVSDVKQANEDLRTDCLEAPPVHSGPPVLVAERVLSQHIVGRRPVRQRPDERASCLVTGVQAHEVEASPFRCGGPYLVAHSRILSSWRSPIRESVDHVSENSVGLDFVDQPVKLSLEPMRFTDRRPHPRPQRKSPPAHWKSLIEDDRV